MVEIIRDWLGGLQLSENLELGLARAIAAIGVIALAYIANLVARRILLKVVHGLARRTATDWDDALIRKRVFTRLAHLVPGLVLWILAPTIFPETSAWTAAIRRGAEIYMLIVAILVVDAVLSAVEGIYNSYAVARRVSITSYIQIARIVLSIGGAIFAFSIILDKSPWLLLSGLGAATAVMMLVFKDSILGFIAGIQLVSNDMVRPGDWIEMPKYGADGEVDAIALTTVKVRNWDKTVTTVPTYALISDWFKNWRGMSESGGRRIKRPIRIDIRSIGFLTPEQIAELSRIEILADYIEQTQQELVRYNTEHGIDDSVAVNGRRMTNIGTFRAYVVAYLRRHPKIHQDMTFLVRQLEATDRGLPLEIYVFSNDQAWVAYEAIQSDIFDHLFASLPWFGLRAYQFPSGADIHPVDAAADSGH